jgi:protein phosphatase
MRLEVVYMTHKGLQKYTTNQDTLLIDGKIVANCSMVEALLIERELNNNKVLLALSDGMGSTPHAEVASKRVLELLWQFTQEQTPFLPIKSIRKIQDTMENMAIVSPEYRGMGATLAGIYIEEMKLTLFNIGDSRIYRLRESKLTQRSKDHTQAQKMLDSGEITQEEFENLSSVYTMLEGYLVAGELDEEEILIEVKKEIPQAGDMWLVCSDGIHDVFSDEEIAELLNQGNSLTKKCQGLFDAVYRVAEDNLSLILIAFKE